MSDDSYDDSGEQQQEEFKFINRSYLEDMAQYGLQSLMSAVASNSFEEFIKHHAIGHIIKIEFMSELEAVTYQGMMEMALLLTPSPDASETDTNWNRIQAEIVRNQYKNYYQYLSDSYAMLNRIENDGKQLHKSLSSFSSHDINDVLTRLQNGVCKLQIGGDLKVTQTTKHNRDSSGNAVTQPSSDTNVRGRGSYFVVDDVDQIICYDNEFAYLTAKFSYQALAHKGVSELDMPLLLAPLVNVSEEQKDERYDYMVERSQVMHQHIVDAYNLMKAKFGSREFCQSNAEWGD